MESEIFAPQNCRVVLKVCQRMLRNQQDAEDAMQETFLNAYKALPQFQERNCKVSTWLVAIARNACLNQIRKRPAVEIVSLSAPASLAEEDGYTIGDLLPAPGLSPETQVFIQEIMEMVDDLCPAWRDTLMMSFQGYRMEEIGATMMVSAVVIKGWLFRARQNVRTQATRKRRRPRR